MGHVAALFNYFEARAIIDDRSEIGHESRACKRPA